MDRITYSAPARVDLSGGAADIFGGCTLSVAIDLRACCTVSLCKGAATICADQGTFRVGESPYELMEAIASTYPIENASIEVSSEIPRSSGLGGSASLCVAALSALNAWGTWGYNAYGIAERAQRIETEGMDLVNGYQDQYAAVFGSCLFMDFVGKGNKPLGQEPYAVVEQLEYPYPIVVAHTGTSHNSGTSNSMLVKKYEQRDDEVYGEITRLNDLTRELRSALIDGSYQKACAIFEENQDVMRRFGRSYPENERLIAMALDAGADAAKVTGAGCGGSIAAFCKSEDAAAAVAEVLRKCASFCKVCHADTGVVRHV